MTRRAVVIGAGVGGLAAAVALQRHGWDTTVYERAPALQAVGAGIAVAPTAVRALDSLGLGGRVRTLAALQGDAGIRRADGRWLSRTSAEFAAARFGAPTVVMHRAALIDLIAGALRPGTLRLGAAVHSVDPDTGRVTLGAGESVADLVVAADGIHSAIRRSLVPAHPGAVYAGVTSWRLVVPAPARAATVWSAESWGAGQVFGIAPLADGRVYCYATATVPAGLPAGNEKQELLRRFGGWHEPIPALVSSTDQVLRTDIHCLDTPLPRFHFGRVALLGDAAHAMTPNLGQGGCQAIEDAVVLAQLVSTPNTGLDAALPAYTAARLPRTTGVARQSRRIGRLTQLSNPVAVRLRDLAMGVAGRLGPGLVIRQVEPILNWRPPGSVDGPETGSVDGPETGSVDGPETGSVDGPEAGDRSGG